MFISISCLNLSLNFELFITVDGRIYPAGTDSDKPSLCYQYRARPACTYVQSDQTLNCWLTTGNLKFSTPQRVKDIQQVKSKCNVNISSLEQSVGHQR